VPLLVVLVLALVIGLNLGFVVKRLRDFNALTIFVWPLMIAAALAPSYVAFNVLNPGAPLQTAEVTAEGDIVELHIPDNHSVMVTAILTEDTEEPGNDKTDYFLRLKGQGWEESYDEVIKRDSGSGGPDVDAMDDHRIEDASGSRKGNLRENLQDRIDLKQYGDITVEVTNWSGSAAASLRLEVVRGPPSDLALWIFTIVITVLALALGVRDNAERLASDLAFLALWAVFIRDKVTPLDDYPGVIWALVPAALIGWLGVAAIEYLVINYFHSRAQAIEKEAEEAVAEAVDKPKDEPTKRRKGAAARRRAAKQDPADS